MNKLSAVMFRWRVIWYFIPYFLSLYMTYSELNKTPHILIFIIGLSISVFGQMLRIWGAGYVGKVARKNTVSYMPLITNGPYQFIRHPLYLGNILSMIGYGISAAAFLSFPHNIIMFFTAGFIAIVIITLIIKHEESILLKLHGQTYKEYSKNIPSMIPLLKEQRQNNQKHTLYSWSAAIKNETHVILFKIFLYTLLCQNLILGIK